ncbi:MAG: alpha/beta fold hydrolase [Anaerolineales bacterium]
MQDLNNHPMTYNGWTLRVRHASRQPARLLLLLHGWTGDENSMWVFTRNLPENLWIVAPRALHPAEEGGYSWRALRPGTWGLPTLNELKPAAEALIRLVDELSASWGVDATQFDVAGFSQGGALTNVLALLYPQRIHRAAVLAGFMPGDTEDLIARQVLKGKPFFIAHGTQDKLVSVERAQESIRLLEQAGAQVTYCEAEVGHKVSADCLRGLESFFTSAM